VTEGGIGAASASAPAGPAVASPGRVGESPRKRSFFGSIKKALAPSSKSAVDRDV
jgi:hypothetical protein